MHPDCSPTLLPPDIYLTLTDLYRHTLDLLPVVDHNVVAIAAVARSGLFPATQLATTLHLPLIIVSPTTTEPVGHGLRLDAGIPDTGRIAIVDDTSFSGHAMRRAVRSLARRFPNPLVRCVTFATPFSTNHIDHAACILPPPHFLDWCLYSHHNGAAHAYDLDGILMPDITPAQAQDDELYEHVITSAAPIRYLRRKDAAAIITARFEKWRPQTQAWLDHHGMRYTRLIMYPATPSLSHTEHNPAIVAAWKALQLNQLPVWIYVESNPTIADYITLHWSGRVVCPDECRVLSAIPFPASFPSRHLPSFNPPPVP